MVQQVSVRRLEAEVDRGKANYQLRSVETQLPLLHPLFPSQCCMQEVVQQVLVGVWQQVDSSEVEGKQVVFLLVQVLVVPLPFQLEPGKKVRSSQEKV